MYDWTERIGQDLVQTEQLVTVLLHAYETETKQNQNPQNQKNKRVWVIFWQNLAALEMGTTLDEWGPFWFFDVFLKRLKSNVKNPVFLSAEFSFCVGFLSGVIL